MRGMGWWGWSSYVREGDGEGDGVVGMVLICEGDGEGDWVVGMVLICKGGGW